MKDLQAWFGLKRFPFDKNIKTQDALDTEPFKECLARLDYIKRRGGIMLLTGDPGVGKTIALRHYVDSLNDNLFKPFYTPLSTLSRADLFQTIEKFFQHIGFLDIGAGTEGLSIMHPIGLRKTADDNRFLLRMDFKNASVCVQAVHAGIHNHIQYQ